MMHHVLAASGASIAWALSTAVPAYGQDDHGEDRGNDRFLANHAAVVVGGMTPLSETSETSIALGADYERRFSPLWGAGVGVDFTIGDHKRTVLFGAAVSFRPIPALRLSTGPAAELVETDQVSGGTKKTAYFVWSIGAFYEFHVGSLAIGPNVILDFVGETKTNLSYGIAVGAGF